MCTYDFHPTHNPHSQDRKCDIYGISIFLLLNTDYNNYTHIIMEFSHIAPILKQLVALPFAQNEHSLPQLKKRTLVGKVRTLGEDKCKFDNH